MRLNQYICKIPLATFKEKLNISDSIVSITPASFQHFDSIITFVIQSDSPLKSMKDRTVPEVSLSEITKKKPGRPKKAKALKP